MKRPSKKSYTKAVCLSAVFGVFGIQHFYLNRYAEGFLDFSLSIGWIYCYAIGSISYGVLFFLADILHTFIATILLLTGNYKDGDDNYVCYPGQKLTHH